MIAREVAQTMMTGSCKCWSTAAIQRLPIKQLQRSAKLYLAILYHTTTAKTGRLRRQKREKERGAIVPCRQRLCLCCISFAGFAQVAFPAEMQLAQNLQEIFPVAEGDHFQKHANAPWNTLRKYAIIMPIRSSKTKQLLCKVQI